MPILIPNITRAGLHEIYIICGDALLVLLLKTSYLKRLRMPPFFNNVGDLKQPFVPIMATIFLKRFSSDGIYLIACQMFVPVDSSYLAIIWI
jgi:hypothetical protein